MCPKIKYFMHLKCGDSGEHKKLGRGDIKSNLIRGIDKLVWQTMLWKVEG